MTANLSDEAKSHLLNESTHFDGAYAFEKIKPEYYLPALEVAIQLAHQKINDIKAQREPADFENTILALESSSEELEKVATIFGNLKLTDGTPEYSKIGESFYPALSKFYSDVSLDMDLFKRVRSVYDHLQTLPDEEMRRLTEKTYLSFKRNGADLLETDKIKLRQIDQELAMLGPKFSDNVLAATNHFEMEVTSSQDIAGLPPSTLEQAKSLAIAKGKSNSWIFNLQAPSYIPFMTYAQSRPLREKMWRAFASRCFGDKFDNQEITLKIINLRHDRAKLLGYDTHADYVLEQRMAEKSSRVETFMNKLLTPSMAAAQRELADLKQFAKSIDGIAEIAPWDVAFYIEKLKQDRFAFSSEDLRPYFPLNQVIEGAFTIAKKLFGIEFSLRNDIPTYHPEAKAYEIKQTSHAHSFVGLLYLDLFPRETKKPGAWMAPYRDQGLSRGLIRRPHISIVCNFTPPSKETPSLLTYDEVKTFFHEFGHALHGLMANCKFRSISGTNVLWDFVELPSQLMENWVEVPEGLEIFAKHYQSGEIIPPTLIKKVLDAEKFMAGWYSLRQVQFGLLDMKWHSTNPTQIKSLAAFENQALSGSRILPVPQDSNISCSFAHIFAGGYSAGYYSYKWAEVLDADAFEYFQEKGIFDPKVAGLYKTWILEKGDSLHPMVLYKNFRGREPDENALLRKDGLI